ncbi:hypothetical protein OHT76_25150 [Streptomyces sp. NBC_00287]|uniref:hypothetical protein n=1 Tax=Streptomyces sp. NBC_00287 TaxID=2975702 RepID=UPI002E2A6A5C|nr:hypothetical protein [Streptomyces sp. NBC_00287]
MFLQQQLKALMRDGATGAQQHDARNLLRSRKQFASFAYIAEQYGYEYAGLSTLSPSGSPNPYFAFRRTPDAAERAARTSAQHPDAIRGGQLPGMRPGGSRLAPLPETQAAVSLLHARIEVDYSGTHEKRGLIQLLIMPFVLLIPLWQAGFTPVPILICCGLWLFTAGLWVLGIALARHRLAKYGRVLEKAGIQ